MGGPYVPPGQSPPFEVVDESHHAAWIIITAALGLVISLVALLIRVYVRLVLCPPFAHDDYTLLGATAVAIIQSSLVFFAASRGFGTSIDLLDGGTVEQIKTLIATSDLLYLFTIYLSKCCVVGIYLRLTPQKPHNRASWATLALCTLWIVAGILILAIGCEFNGPWMAGAGHCRNMLSRWEFITAMDVLTELMLFALAVTLLKGLFMSLQRKAAILSAFLFRLPLIVFAIFHIYTLHTASASPDLTLAAVDPAIWVQVELNYSLIACSVFCLRPFMAAVSTNYGTAGDSNLESSSASASQSRSRSRSQKTAHPASGLGSGSGGGSFALRSMANSLKKEVNMLLSSSSSEGKKRKQGGGGSLGHDEVKLTANNGHRRSRTVGTISSVVHDERPDDIELVQRHDVRSAGSDGSTRMMIRKDVQYSVEYDRGRSESEYWDLYKG